MHFNKYTAIHKMSPYLYDCIHMLTEKKQKNKNKKKISAASKIVVTVRNAPKICQGHKPNIWLTLFQISSKSVHFRRSYSRMREDRFLPHRLFFDS